MREIGSGPDLSAVIKPGGGAPLPDTATRAVSPGGEHAPSPGGAGQVSRSEIRKTLLGPGASPDIPTLLPTMNAGVAGEPQRVPSNAPSGQPDAAEPPATAHSGEPSAHVGSGAVSKELPASAPPKQDLAAQEKALPSVKGNFSNELNPPPNIKVEDGKISFYGGRPIPVETVSEVMEPYRVNFVGPSERVSESARQVTPEINRVFSPFNGGETIGLTSDYTLATDRLPIGSQRQVEALHGNEFAKGIYVGDKVGHGYSYSGVTAELGYLGAALQWDITEIQKGSIQNVTYLDASGQPLEDPEASAAGIVITYTTTRNQTRVHEQYTGDNATLPEPVRAKLAAGGFDGLYIRGAESLVAGSEFFPEYKSYVGAVRPGGVVVSDAIVEDLTWHMEGTFGEHREVPLQDWEQFGYAGKEATVNTTTPGVARHGHVNILQKAGQEN
jgi:hypothetical protein